MINVGIVGLGRIAGVMADTLEQMEDASLYAVGSRSLEKAQAFNTKYQAPQAYGSYDDLFHDEKVDLVYIATPHTQHYEVARRAMECGKNVLVEKAFTVNAKETEKLIAVSKKTGCLLCEAIWTRFLPMRTMIDDVVASGIIGSVNYLTANLGYFSAWKDRMHDPNLAGGALLDVGVYPLNFAVMVLGKDIQDIKATMIPYKDTFMDATDQITLVYKDKKMADLTASMVGRTDRRGLICGSEGYIEVENINNPEKLSVFDNTGRLMQVVVAPKQISGYEYEVRSCAKAISEKKRECPEMMHSETLFMMNLYDSIRKDWGLKYPTEE